MFASSFTLRNPSRVSSSSNKHRHYNAFGNPHCFYISVYLLPFSAHRGVEQWNNVTVHWVAYMHDKQNKAAL